MKHFLKILVLIVSASFCLEASAATTWTVTNSGDGAANAANCPGAGCRLRDALAAAADSDTIDFSVTGTILLINGQLVVDKSITISGPGANNLAVNGNATNRVFYIDPSIDVTIAGVTITNGSTAIGNTSQDVSGAGIFNNHSNLTVSNCTISGNSAPNFGLGGGIYNNGQGGIFSGHATLTVINSALSGNSASLVGGGIYSVGFNGGSATVKITNSTISSNSATTNGGGIFSDGRGSGSAALVEIVNSTLSANYGGGIYNWGEIASGSAALEIGSSILNVGDGSGANIVNDNGMVTSLGYNLSSDDASTLLNQSTDQNSTDPKLGPLQDNGGPTFTHALKNESPAIDAGKNPNGLAYDQRGPGFDRTVDLGLPIPTGGDGTDIGAFELQQFTGEADLLISMGVDKTSVKQGDLLTYTITVQNFGPATAMNAVMNDLLASGSTFVSANANKGSFTRPPVGQTGTVTWYLGNILSDGQESAQIVVTVIVRGKTTITNTGSVSSLLDDPNTANNTASIAVSIASGKGGGGRGGHGQH